MSQVFAINENIGTLAKASSTTITMTSTYQGKPTKITVGGKQYKASGTITLNTAAANGINALDTGALAANTLYYIYAVQASGVLGLVASVTPTTTGPTGFLAWKEVGRFRTDSGAANVNTVVNRLIGQNQVATNAAITEWENVTSNFTIGSITIIANLLSAGTIGLYKWRRVGSNMEISYNHYATSQGAGGVAADVVEFKLPVAGLTPAALGELVGIAANQRISSDIDAGASPGDAVETTATGFIIRRAETTWNSEERWIQKQHVNTSSAIILTASIPIAQWRDLFD